MIIIKASHNDKESTHRYRGKISITRGDSFIIIQARWENGNDGWEGNQYDGFFIEDVVSIEGVDEYARTNKNV